MDVFRKSSISETYRGLRALRPPRSGAPNTQQVAHGPGAKSSVIEPGDLLVNPKYDDIGINYSTLRNPDWRIAKAIESALGDAKTVLNVGAGTGSYEPRGRAVTAVEPSLEMIRQRRPDAAEVIQASAEQLPFDDDAFDAAMAVLTIHHWRDPEGGLREMRRVTRGPIVLLTFDPAARPWLTDYLPELAILDEAKMPAMSSFERWMRRTEVSPVRVPHDCTDGFLYAYWRRPRAYLDPHIRTGSSSFWAIEKVELGLEKLKQDLESGEWERRYHDLLDAEAYDAGYRLVVSRGSALA
jgi:SAM-dependent methyltransferase